MELPLFLNLSMVPFHLAIKICNYQEKPRETRGALETEAFMKLVWVWLGPEIIAKW